MHLKSPRPYWKLKKLPLKQLAMYWHSIVSHFNPHRRLATRIGLGIALLAITFSTLLSIFIGQSTSLQLQTQQEQSLAKLSFTLANRLDRGMFERYREIQIVTTLQDIRSEQASPQQRQGLLNKLQSTYPDYAWIGLTDTQGRVIASTQGILEGADVSARPWFREGKTKPFVGDVHEALLLASLLPNSTEEPLRFVDIAAPVFDETGNFLGVLGAHLYWNWAERAKQDLLEPLEETANMEVLILAEDDTILLGSQAIQGEKLKLKSTEAAHHQSRGAIVETWSDGQKYLTAFAQCDGYKDYSGLGWKVLVQLSEAIAFAPAWKLQQQILWGGLFLGILFATLGWLIVESITRPLVAIATIAERLRRGEAGVRMRFIPGEDEVARLSWSLNKLVNKLFAKEEALLASNERLQQELSERQRVEDSLRDTEELSELKSHFISLTSHEFRNPLTTIFSSMELLESYDAKLSLEKKQKYWQRIRSAVERMLKMLDEVMLIGKAEARKLKSNPTCFDLCKFCEDLVEEMQISQRNNTIDHRLQGNIVLACMDKKLLHHILANLLSNAIKYSPEGQKVDFEVNFQGKEVEFIIKDQGIGIPAEDQEHLFESFHRASNVGEIPGTGLGLVVVKQSVDILQGQIAVESTTGVGTTFTVTLPLKPESRG
ncbi:MAG: ATP-binding protein [Coleofasciculaceae cyanobacterium]